MDRGTWQVIVHGGHKESNVTESNTHISYKYIDRDQKLIKIRTLRDPENGNEAF